MQARIESEPRPGAADSGGSQHSSDSEDWTLIAPTTQYRLVKPDRCKYNVLRGQIPTNEKQEAEATEDVKMLCYPHTSPPPPPPPPPSAQPEPQREDASTSSKSIAGIKNKKRPDNANRPLYPTERDNERYMAIMLVAFGWAICYIMSEGLSLSKAGSLLGKVLRSSDDRRFNFVYLDPADHAYTELKLLEEELLECIRSENPHFEDVTTWLKKGSSQQRDPAEMYATPQLKPLMGMVCYGKESKWRKRFERLKTEHHFDMAKTLKRVRNQLTYEILELHNPALRFRFIINQMDYLNTLDQRRKDRLIEKLEAENRELKRKQSSTSRGPTRTDNNNNSNTTRQQVASSNTNHKINHGPAEDSLITLQGQNRRLRIENEMLKQSLGEKAGTVYIKQSVKLEKCERQNNVLHQFQQKAASAISRGLKQIDVQINDFGAILSDRDESLTARLNLTLNSLDLLVEETTQLAAKNKSFQAELDEARLLNIMVVREAENLIESNSASNPDDYELMKVLPTTNEDPHVLGQSGALEPDAETLRDLDNLKCDTDNECLVTKVNWLMKRAKLREKLRKVQIKESETSENDGFIREDRYTRQRCLRPPPSSKRTMGAKLRRLEWEKCMRNNRA